MSTRPVRHRTTARVLPVNGRWTPAALDADGAAADDELTTHMRAAARRILGEA